MSGQKYRNLSDEVVQSLYDAMWFPVLTTISPKKSLPGQHDEQVKKVIWAIIEHLDRSGYQIARPARKPKHSVVAVLGPAVRDVADRAAMLGDDNRIPVMNGRPTIITPDNDQVDLTTLVKEDDDASTQDIQLPPD